MALHKYKKLSGNILLFSISSLGHKILAFLLIPLYTSFLSPEQYGTIDLIGSTVSLLLPLFTLNISEAVMRFTIEDKDNDNYLTLGLKTIFTGTLILTCLLTLLHFLPVLESYKPYYSWVFILYIANSLYTLAQNYLRATDRIPVMVTASLINSAVMLFLDVALIAGLKLGVTGYYAAMLSGLGSAFVFMELKGNLHRHIHLNNVKPEVKRACLAYCIPTIFTALAWWANSSIDRYFVTGMCGVRQNGIYSIAYKIPTVLSIFQSIFNQAWTISAITEFDRNDSDGFYGKTYEMYNSMMVLVTSGIMLFNILFSKILYANDFFEAWQYVPLLLVSSLFSAMAGYMGSIFSAVKDMKTCAYTVVVSAVVNMSLNAILIPLYGVQGAAIAPAVSYLSSWGIRMIVIRRYIKMKLNLVRDFIIYALLFAQMLFALSETHMYAGQVLILLCIAGCYFSNYKKAFTQLIRGVKKA